MLKTSCKSYYTITTYTYLEIVGWSCICFAHGKECMVLSVINAPLGKRKKKKKKCTVLSVINAPWVNTHTKKKCTVLSVINAPWVNKKKCTVLSVINAPWVNAKKKKKSKNDVGICYFKILVPVNGLKS